MQFLVIASILSPWWLGAPWAAIIVVGFITLHNWSEMIAEINACTPEAEQIPYSPVDVIGRPNKFARLEHGSIWNMWRLHKRLFPNSRRRKIFRLAVLGCALCVLAAIILFGLVADFKAHSQIIQSSRDLCLNKPTALCPFSPKCSRAECKC